MGACLRFPLRLVRHSLHRLPAFCASRHPRSTRIVGSYLVHGELNTHAAASPPGHRYSWLSVSVQSAIFAIFSAFHLTSCPAFGVFVSRMLLSDSVCLLGVG